MSLHTDRRTFLRRSAIVMGGVWAAPIVTAVPAGAATGSEPPRPPLTEPPTAGSGTEAPRVPGVPGTEPQVLPGELAWTGNDQARLVALGGAAVATGAALVALNREDPREEHG